MQPHATRSRGLLVLLLAFDQPALQHNTARRQIGRRARVLRGAGHLQRLSEIVAGVVKSLVKCFTFILGSAPLTPHINGRSRTFHAAPQPFSQSQKSTGWRSLIHLPILHACRRLAADYYAREDRCMHCLRPFSILSFHRGTKWQTRVYLQAKDRHLDLSQLRYLRKISLRLAL